MPWSVHNRKDINLAENKYKKHRKPIYPRLILNVIKSFACWKPVLSNQPIKNKTGLVIGYDLTYGNPSEKWVLIANISYELYRLRSLCSDVSILIKQLNGKKEIDYDNRRWSK
jgi:hypothetical protein